MSNPLIAFLQLFQELPEADQALIADAFELADYKEDEYLFKAGRICTRLFFICNGIVRVLAANEKGAEVTYFFLKENQFCSILNSFNNQIVAEESIQAVCDVQALAVTRTKLSDLYIQLPYLKTLIDSITQQALLDKIQTRNAYMGQDSTTRYRLFVARQPEIALRAPLSDIASYLCVTPQSLSRIRRNIR